MRAKWIAIAYWMIALVILVAPFVIYHVQQKYAVLALYSHFDQNPGPANRPLPSKEDQEYIRILAIESGGVYGILPAHVLEYLEAQTGRRINDLFDLMVGTCTGALQTVLLTTPGKDGQPKFTAKELLDIYNTDEKKLFYHPWYHRLLTLNGVIGPKYQTTARYALFQKCLDGLYFDQLLNNVVIPAYDVRSQNPMLFLNWNQPGREDTNFELASLLMGAVSPPGVFPSVIFGLHGKRLVLVDGTLFADNPSIVAVLLAMSIYPNKKYILVTLGTGVTEETPHLTTEVLNWGELQWSKQLLPTIYKSNAKFNTMLVQKMFPVPLDLYYFNTRVSAFDTQLDNVSQWNIERLNRYGKQMVVENQERLAELASRLVQP